MPKLDAQLQRRVVIENVRPSVDDGRFPIKRTVGDAVIVRADVFADGHDTIAAALLYRREGTSTWLEVPMVSLGNDRWQARFLVEGLGGFEYTIEGWVDRFASWRHELATKFGAGQDVASELLEGATLVQGVQGVQGVHGCMRFMRFMQFMGFMGFDDARRRCSGTSACRLASAWRRPCPRTWPRRWPRCRIAAARRGTTGFSA